MKCGNINFRILSKKNKQRIVRGLNYLSLNDNLVCESCVKGKQVKISFKIIHDILTQRPIELILIDMFRLTRIE